MTTMMTTMTRLSITTTTLLRPLESCPILDIPFPPKLTIEPVSFLSLLKGKRITKLKSIFKGSNKRRIENTNLLRVRAMLSINISGMMWNKAYEKKV